jgi:hypothetical protein
LGGGWGGFLLKIKKMKKQILFLAMLTMAIIFAGTNNVFGQMRPSNQAPTPLDPANCEPSPLNPMPGVPFTYKVGNTNMVGAVGYTWWATKNPNFINTTSFLSDTTSMLEVKPDELLAATLTTGTYAGAFQSMGDEIEITWTANILASTEYQGTPNIAATPSTPSPTFVVVQADGSCNNNLQVYELNPMPAFTLDIANISPVDTSTLAIGDPTDQCVDIVRSATYAAGEVTMDYGTDTLLFEVIAANYVTSWLPQFNLVSGITGSQTAVIGWAYTKADALDGNFIEAEQSISVGTALDGTTQLAPLAGLNTSEGTSIYVRVIITNNTYESISDQPFVLAVDGVDASNQWDIDQASATCSATDADLADQATHTVTARPDITDLTNDSNTTPDNTFVISPRN